MSLVCNIEDRKGFVKSRPEALAINVKHIKPIVKFMIRQGLALEDILSGTNLRPGDLVCRDISINALQHHQLLLNVFKHAPDMSFAAQLGEQDFINQDSLLASRVMSCETVEEAMNMLSDYYQLWTNQFDLSFDVTERWGIFSIRPHVDFGPTLPFYIEYVYAILYAFGCFCLGEKTLPLIFEFSYSKPERSTHYARYFSETVRFNQSIDRVLLPKHLLSQKLIFSNRELARKNDHDVQVKFKTLHADDIVHRTRLLIEKSTLSSVSLESVASELCMSSRSLRRHLQNEGQSFQNLMDQQRKARAKTLLRASRNSIQEIALLLGYNDTSAFSRAFKRWEGLSPKEYQHSVTDC